MKNKCMLLVKNRLTLQIGVNEIRYGNGKSKISKRFMMLFIIFIIALFAIYSGAYAYGLHYLGAVHLIPTYAFLLSTIVTLFFTMFKTSGELFGYQDYDFLMSLPIKTTSIIASRFITLYVWNTVISFIIMLPMGIIYSIYIKPDIMFYPLWLISMFVVSFIPTTIAVVIGALIGAISSKQKNSRMMSGVLQIVLLAVILTAPYFVINSELITKGELKQEFLKGVLVIVHDKLSAFYPVTVLFRNSVMDYSIVDFLFFIVLSIGWYFLFVEILSLKYKEINTALFTYCTSSDYEVHSLKQSNILSALYSKELKQWYTCPIYLTNSIAGAIITLILSIVFVVLGPSQIAEMGKGIFDFDLLNSAFPYVIAVGLGMCCTTMASISLEGKKVWLLQSLPIYMKDIINSKILVNLTITIPFGLICSTLYNVAVKNGFAREVLSYIIPIVFSLFSAVFGLWFNLRTHDYRWESETQVIKQSTTSLIGMLLTPIIGLVVIAIYIFFRIDFMIFGLAAAALLTLITTILYQSMINKYNKIPL